MGLIERITDMWESINDPTHGAPDPASLATEEELRNTMAGVMEMPAQYRIVSTGRIRQMLQLAYEDGLRDGAP